MEQVTGIGGVFFRAQNPENLAAWYQQQLGLPINGTLAEFPWREAADPNKPGNTVWSLFPKDTDYFGPDRPVFMVNYRVQNLDRMVAQLRAAGVKVDKVEDSEYGKFTWISDPEGNRIELWEPKAG
jgi:predicted enzyme related to lactoylglutathione lyase